MGTDLLTSFAVQYYILVVKKCNLILNDNIILPLHGHQMQINMRIMSADTKFNCLHNFPPVFCKCMGTILCFGVEFETGFVEFLQLMNWISVGRVVQVVVGVVLCHASTASYS